MQQPKRISPLPVLVPQMPGMGAFGPGLGAVPALARPPLQTNTTEPRHTPTWRMHFDLSSGSLVSYSKILEQEKKKRQQEHQHQEGVSPPDSDVSSSDSEGSSSDPGSEDTDQKGSSGSDMEDASCASDVAVTSGGEGGARVSGGCNITSQKRQKRRPKRQKLVAYEADFVDDTEVLDAHDGLKEPKYGSTSNGFYLNKGRIETVRDETEAKEAAAGKAKGRPPRPTRAREPRQGAASADETPLHVASKRRAGGSDQARSSADEHPAGARKRKPDAEQARSAPVLKKAKKADGPAAVPPPNAAQCTAPFHPAAPPEPVEPARATATAAVAGPAFPPNMSLAQRAALAGKLACSAAPVPPKPAAPAPAVTSLGKEQHSLAAGAGVAGEAGGQSSLPGPAVSLKAAAAGAPAVVPAAADMPATGAGSTLPVGSIAERKAAGERARRQQQQEQEQEQQPLQPEGQVNAAQNRGASAAHVPTTGAVATHPLGSLAARKERAKQLQLQLQQQQQQQQGQEQQSPQPETQAPATGTTHLTEPAPAVAAGAAEAGAASASANPASPAAPPRRTQAARSFKGTDCLLKTITNKLREASDGTHEPPTASALKQAMKQSLINLALALHRNGNLPEEHAAVTRALAAEGSRLWADEQVISAELKAMQDRQLGHLDGMRNDLRVMLTSGTGVVPAPAASGAAGAAQQELAPQALATLEKLLLLQRKLHGQATDAALLEEVAVWGAAQSLQVDTLEQALDKHKRQKPGAPQAALAEAGTGASAAGAGAAEAGVKESRPLGKGRKAKVTAAASPEGAGPSTPLAHSNGHHAAATTTDTNTSTNNTNTAAAAASSHPATTAGAAAAAAPPPPPSPPPPPPGSEAQPPVLELHSGSAGAPAAKPAGAGAQVAGPLVVAGHVATQAQELQTGPHGQQQGLRDQAGAAGTPPGGTPPASPRSQDVRRTGLSAAAATAGGGAGAGAAGSAAVLEAGPAANADAAAAEGADGNMSPGSGAEVDADGVSGAADDEAGPSAAERGHQGPASNTGVRQPEPAEDAAQFEAAVQQAVHEGADADVLRGQYKALGTVGKAMLKALCYAGKLGLSTKDIRAHIQQRNYLLNWKGDTKCINQAIKGKAIAAAVAHVGNYRYAARAFPGVDEREQEKPAKLERLQAPQQ